MARKPRSFTEYRVYDLPMEAPVIVLTGDDWRISDVMSSRLHFHNCMEIGFCHSDEGVLVFEGERISFRAGDVTIIPYHVPHTTCSKKGTRSLWSYIFMDFSGILSDMLNVDSPIAKNNSDWIPQDFLYNRTQHPRIHYFANCLLEELKEKKNDFVQVIKSLTLVLCYELLRLHEKQKYIDSSRNVKSFVLKPALEYIRQNYMKQISIKMLADVCHLSENHFRRLFLSIMGTTPLNFINSTRIGVACVMLKTSDLSVLSIAEAVGINSISTFNRNFNQIMSISPHEYRNSNINDDITPKHKYVLSYKGWTKPEEHPKFISEEE